jgi:hypothetical protein
MKVPPFPAIYSFIHSFNMSTSTSTPSSPDMNAYHILSAIGRMQHEFQANMDAAADELPISVTPFGHTVNSTGWSYSRPGCPCQTCTGQEDETNTPPPSTEPPGLSNTPTPAAVPPIEIPYSLPERSDCNGIPVTISAPVYNDTIRYLTEYADLLHNTIEGMRNDYWNNLSTNNKHRIMPPEFDEMCGNETAVRNLITKLQRSG